MNWQPFMNSVYLVKLFLFCGSVLNTTKLGPSSDEMVTFLLFPFCSTNGNLYFQMFEDLLIALEHLEEKDHKNRGNLSL